MRKQFADAEELKNVKWLFLKNNEKLSDAQRQQIDLLLKKSEYQLLKQAYEAKESFRAILELF